MSTLFTLPNQLPFYNSAPHGLAKLYFYRAGTTTHQAVYTTAALSVAHDQPVQSDAAGVLPPIFLNPSASYDYRLMEKTSAEVLVRDIDNIPRNGYPSQTELGLILYPRTDAEIAASVTPVNYAYAIGVPNRYQTNATPGTTNMLVGLQAAIDVCKNAAVGAAKVLLLKESYRYDGELDLTGLFFSEQLEIEGMGMYASVLIPAFNGGNALDLTGSVLVRMSNLGIRSHGSFTQDQLMLCARVASNNSAGNHKFDNVHFQGRVNNAVVCLWGSEENNFHNCWLQSMSDATALVQAVKISECGFIPVSNFQTLGTGEGGVGVNTFTGSCRITNETGVVQTKPLVKLYGCLSFGFYSTYFASYPGASGHTIDINGSTYPSDAANLYPACGVFDNCTDENAWGNQSTQRTLSFGATTVAGMTNIRGITVNNCEFMRVYGQDGSIVDAFNYHGGKFSNSVSGPTGSKFSFYNLKSSHITVPDSEKALTATVRNIGGANTFRGFDVGGIAIGTDTTSNIYDSSGNLLHAGYLLSKSATGGVGYSTGAGGAVTQITSASTGITLNTVTGTITTVALTTAAGAEESFVLTNSRITILDVLMATTTYAGAGTPVVSFKGIANGTITVVITNLHAADALDAVVVFNFAILRGAAS